MGISDPTIAQHVLTDYTNALLSVKAEESPKIYEARAKVSF